MDRLKGYPVELGERQEICVQRRCALPKSTFSGTRGSQRLTFALACGSASSLRLSLRKKEGKDTGHQCVKGVKACETVPKRPDAASFFSMDVLHRPLGCQPQGPQGSLSKLKHWVLEAFDVANQEFFNGELENSVIEMDSTWHLQGGAGGSHPGTHRIVLDPSVHICYRDLSATLLHEMLHLHVEDADGEEHGPLFLQACLELNEKIMASGAACFCRLGEFDTPLDQSLLAEEGVSADACDALLSPRDASPSPSLPWDSGLLVGDLCQCMSKQEAQQLAARIQCKAIITSCNMALRKGYVTWSLRSRTMAQYCACKVARDYQSFSDYCALWSL